MDKEDFTRWENQNLTDDEKKKITLLRQYLSDEDISIDDIREINKESINEN